MHKNKLKLDYEWEQPPKRITSIILIPFIYHQALGKHKLRSSNVIELYGFLSFTSKKGVYLILAF